MSILIVLSIISINQIVIDILLEAMEESLQLSPLPSRVLQSFINSEFDDTELEDVFSSSLDAKPNINALVTLPRTVQSLSALHDDAIAEESGTSSKTFSSLSRKAPIRKISIPDRFGRKSHYTLTKSQSADMPNPYNPNKPLTKHPIKQQRSTDHLQSQDNYFTRTKSINATIGPLTKEVCGKLNISWENSDPCVSPQETKVWLVITEIL